MQALCYSVKLTTIITLMSEFPMEVSEFPMEVSEFPMEVSEFPMEVCGSV
mgnify:FL=1